MKTLLNTTVVQNLQDGNKTTVTLLCSINTNKLPISIFDIGDVLRRFPEMKYDDYSDMFVFETTASATCSGNDIFDERKGFCIAESKAQAKAYYIAARVYETLIDIAEYKYSTLCGYASNTYKCMKHSMRHAKELGN